MFSKKVDRWILDPILHVFDDVCLEGLSFDIYTKFVAYWLPYCHDKGIKVIFSHLQSIIEQAVKKEEMLIDKNLFIIKSFLESEKHTRFILGQDTDSYLLSLLFLFDQVITTFTSHPVKVAVSDCFREIKSCPYVDQYFKNTNRLIEVVVSHCLNNKAEFTAQ